MLLEWKDGPKNPNDLGISELNYNVFVDDEKSESFKLDFLLKQTPQVNFGGLNIDIQMEGFFTFPEGSSEDEMQRLIRINGCSILYSTLRGHISSITSNFPCDRIILPSIEIRNL